MEFLSVILFAFAVSLDGFGAGVAYGMRRIIIPWKSLLIICLASTFAITLSMFFGHLLGSFISPIWAERIGSTILVSMGLWIILQAYKTNCRRKVSARDKENKSNLNQQKIVTISIKSLGIVIQILREPEKADFDESGTINSKEAVVLGFALAMDALGAGFGAAMAGFTPFLTPLAVGVFKFFLVSLGLHVGASKLSDRLGYHAAFVPGLVLILLGII
ncbi:MAG: sporulation membrane protein YtaF [Bacillota bacterium]|nr:sporulation membrane protein YtaF [Bacillota bacterium]